MGCCCGEICYIYIYKIFAVYGRNMVSVAVVAKCLPAIAPDFSKTEISLSYRF